MRTTLKALIMAGMLLPAATALAQCVELEAKMNNLVNEYSTELCTSRTFNETRDPINPERPLQSKCEVVCFTIKKKSAYQRELLDEMIRIMETEGRKDRNCYSVNNMNGRENVDANRRKLMIGENTDNYIELGKDYDNYWNVNAIDTADATKRHRYAYALEWRESGKNIYLRYIVTYAKIPSAATAIRQDPWPIIDLGPSRIPKDGPIQAENNARVYFLGKDYPIQALGSVAQEALQREGVSPGHGKSIVAWTDSLQHDTDPVTDVVLRLQQVKGITAADLLCNDYILLIFSHLKQGFLEGKDQEFNAISIYSLCRHAREYGFFTGIQGIEASVDEAKKELDQLKRDIMAMRANTTDEACRNYLQMAYNELDQIK